MHRAFTFDHTDLITSTKPSTLLTLPSYLFILYNIGLNMGKPMGRHPFPITLTQNPKRAPKVGRDPVISASPGAPSLTGCRCPKRSNMTKCSSKLGQGPTGPQHSPVTHPESLWSDHLRFECLKLGSSYFDLLQCDNLFLSELLDHCVIYWSFHALFCGDENLFKLGCLALNFSEQVA
jgi:hypothetical protein